MTELFIMAAPTAVTLSELGIIFTLALFMIMAYWTKIPYFHIFAGAVSFYAAWALSDRTMLLIVFGGNGMIQMYSAYFKVKG